MSAAGRNFMKVIVGSAIASGVAALVARKAADDEQAENDGPSLSESLKSAPDRLRERWERAREAGTAAESETTEYLTEVFREKVNNPDALTPPRPPSR